MEKSIRLELTENNKTDFALLHSLPGVGDVISMTILLEVGDISRFQSVGKFASYARCVESKLISNNKKKGRNNRKCGNRYLSWAFHEAAHTSLRYPAVKAFYDRKKRKTNGMIAIRAVAHKLVRAAYHVLKTKQPFDMERAFG